jgi:hypothetical protein
VGDSSFATRLSPAVAGSRIVFGLLILGLAPQALFFRPLRGLGARGVRSEIYRTLSPAVAGSRIVFGLLILGLAPQALFFRPLRGLGACGVRSEIYRTLSPAIAGSAFAIAGSVTSVCSNRTSQEEGLAPAVYYRTRRRVGNSFPIAVT